MELKNKSKTLFIPLLGKAEMSKQNLIIKDLKAEEIVNNIDLGDIKNSKYLSMYMALRSKIIDDLVNEYMNNHFNATVIHLGCGLDSRVLRVNDKYTKWYDVDYKEVIDIRKEYYEENLEDIKPATIVKDEDYSDIIDIINKNRDKGIQSDFDERH